MTTSGYREPAKIYQFPTKARAVAGRFDDVKFVSGIPSPSVVPAACGSAWYHDEAIRDAQELTRKN
jgi:hypothetical protein